MPFRLFVCLQITKTAIQFLRCPTLDYTAVLIGAGNGTMISAGSAILETALAAEISGAMPSDEGTHDLLFEIGSREPLRYTLYLPTVRPRDKTQPLVLVLHYGGQPVGFYGRSLITLLVLPALAALKPVIIAPVAMGGDWTTGDNERAVLELLAMVERTYLTDPGRRLVTGYSMGGVGAWHMVARHGDRFSAAIAISGFKPIAPESPETPMYALHSRSDSIFDADQLQRLIDGMAAASREAKVEFVDGVDHYDISAFVPLLERTVPWLRALWQREPTE